MEKNAQSTASLPKTLVRPSSEASEKHDPYLVALEPEEPEDDPTSLPLWRRWLATVIVNMGAICVTGASAMAATAEHSISAEFHVSVEVTILSVTLFTLGLGVGPVLIGPLAEMIGQRKIYLGSFFTMWCFTWPTAFSHSLAVHLIFRFLAGFCGSAFLSIGGATITNLFRPEDVGVPMAAYTISTFIGPVLTPMFQGFVFQNAGWRWMYYVLLMWSFAETIALLAVPETVTAVVLRKKAAKLRKSTGDQSYYAASERAEHDFGSDLWKGLKDILSIMLFDRMAFLLDVWLSLILGILYLTFQAFPIIFAGKHGFNPGQTNLSFMGVLIGELIALASMVYWAPWGKRVAQRHGGNPPPEVWFAMGKIGGILIPISLFCLAFTTYQHVHWVAPIVASLPFGTGIAFVYISVFTYFVTAYRPMASATLSGCAIMRTSFGAAFPLFANQMYARLGTVGATALLAGLMTLMAPLPFVFEKIGARLREKSPYATHCSERMPTGGDA